MLSFSFLPFVSVVIPISCLYLFIYRLFYGSCLSPAIFYRLFFGLIISLLGLSAYHLQPPSVLPSQLKPTIVSAQSPFPADLPFFLTFPFLASILLLSFSSPCLQAAKRSLHQILLLSLPSPPITLLSLSSPSSYPFYFYFFFLASPTEASASPRLAAFLRSSFA